MNLYVFEKHSRSATTRQVALNLDHLSIYDVQDEAKYKSIPVRSLAKEKQLQLPQVKQLNAE